jgi:drug/metabolite transporter (DMT)-like permease
MLGTLFGTTLIASRFSVGQYHPTNYVALRLVLASLAHLGFYLFTKRKFPRDPQLWRRAGLIGVFGSAIPMTSIVSSMQYQSSGLTSVLLTIGPAITVVMAHFFLPDESLTLRKAVGVAMALGGAVLLAVLGESGLPDVETASPIGYGLVFMAMFFGSATSIYIRRFLQDEDTFDIASIRMFFAAAGLMLFAGGVVGFDLSGVTRQGYFALGYASLAGTFLGMILVVRIVQRFGATASAMTAYVIPIVAAVGGTLVLDETITPGMYAGMTLIVIGIAIINRRPRRGLPHAQG